MPRSYLIPFEKALFTEHTIPIYKQFETNKHLYPEEYEILKDHFIIKQSDLEKAGWCDLRFKVHELAADLVHEGYIPVHYTKAILDKDLEDLKSQDTSKYQFSLIRFSAFSPLPPAGKRIVMHFAENYARERWEFYPIYRSIDKLIKKDITREDIVYNLSRRAHMPRHPAFYRALFKQWFDVADKKIYDLDPNWGFKALAVLIDGGKYFCDSPYLSACQGIANYIGGVADGPIENHYDLIIVSDAMPVEISEIDNLLEKYSKLSEYLMISVRTYSIDDWKHLIEKYKPKRTLRVSTEMASTAIDDNMIMIIKS